MLPTIGKAEKARNYLDNSPCQKCLIKKKTNTKVRSQNREMGAERSVIPRIRTFPNQYHDKDSIGKNEETLPKSCILRRQVAKDPDNNGGRYNRRYQARISLPRKRKRLVLGRAKRIGDEGPKMNLIDIKETRLHT